MEQIKAVLAAQNQYLQCYGHPSEEDHSLNDINRALIEAMNQYCGQVYVGSINGHTALIQYDGRKIYNFQYDFCVANYDSELDKLLQHWKKEHCVDQLNAIYEQLQVLDGHLHQGSARRERIRCPQKANLKDFAGTSIKESRRGLR